MPETVITEKSTQVEELQKFSDATSIHGLIAISGTKANRQSLFARLIWGAAFTVALSLAIWKSVINLNEYLRFDVRTINKYQYVDDGLKLPAITLCNANYYRRSVVSVNDNLMMGLTRLHHDGIGILDVYKNNRKLCPVIEGGGNNTEATKIGNPLEIIQRYGLEQASIMIGMTSKLSIVGMWWNNTKIDDWSNVVHDHFTDKFVCSTVNPGGYTEKNLVDYMFRSTVNSSDDDDDGWITTASGPNNGLRMLLDVTQQEYCGDFFRFGGAGFNLIVHDQTESLGINEREPIYIHPGQSYDIAIKPRQFLRETKRLGYCNDKFDNGVEYSRSVCVWLCFIRYIYDRCECLMFTESEYVEKTNKLLDMTDANECQASDLPCFVYAATDFFLTFASSICKTQCNHQCTETVYLPTLSSTRLARPDLLLKRFPELKNRTANSSLIDKNYVLLNVYFESLNVHIVTEFQRVSFQDFWFNIGNNISLYLGMSFMSLFEPLHIAILLCHVTALRLFAAFRKYRNKRKVVAATLKVLRNYRKKRAVATTLKVLRNYCKKQPVAPAFTKVRRTRAVQITNNSDVCETEL